MRPLQSLMPSPLLRRLLVPALVVGALGFAGGAIVNQGIGRALTLPEDAEALTFTDMAPGGAIEAPGVESPGTEAPDSTASATPSPLPNASPRTLTSRQYADVIVRRNIFDSSAVYDPDAAAAPGGDCTTSASLKLLATIVADKPEYSSALISTGGKDARASGFVIGDDVGSEGRIVSIEQKKVCVSGGGCFCMGTESGLGARAPSGEEPAEGGVTKLGENQFAVDESVLQNAMENVEMLATQMRVSPHKGSDGQIDGYKVSSIRKGSLFDKLGIKNGDIVHAVNGQALTSAEGALGVYQTLKSEKSFTFDISRKSQKQKMEYEVR